MKAAILACFTDPTPASWHVGPFAFRDRAAFVLCALEGLTQAEAAARLGRAPGAVAGQVARAKKRLVARLAGRGVVPGLATLGTTDSRINLSSVRALWSDRLRYDQLARASFIEYESRLNWQTAAKRVKQLLSTLIPS